MIRIARPGLERIPTYAPQPLVGVDLDLRDNTNLWGAPPRALAAVQTALQSAAPAAVAGGLPLPFAPANPITQYPSVGASRLVEALAATLGVDPRCVVTGCGSDDVIDAAFRALASPGERVAHADPSFSMVPVFARLNGLEPIGVPLLADGAADVDGLLATGARIIYLCSPNNPTGTVTPRAEVLRLIEHAPGIVLIDEAYAEFAGTHPLWAEATAQEHVLILRTFSKAWGLAGLRVGYGVGSPALIEAVVRSRGPYTVNALADLAAATAVTEDRAWLAQVVDEARANRTRLDALVRGRRGVRPWASQGNFVFWAVDADAMALADRFQERGIGVRAFRGLRGIGDALRIGVAPWSQLGRVAQLAEELWP